MDTARAPCLYIVPALQDDLMDKRYPFDDLPEPGPGFSTPPGSVRRWDGGHALLYFVCSALFTLLAALALIGPFGFYGSVIASEVAIFVLIPLLLRRHFDTGWESWTRRADVGSAFWLWCLIAVVSFAIVQSNLPVLLDRIWPIPTEQFEFYREHLSAGDPVQFLLLLLTAAIVPGICEELAFRGLIHTGLRRSFGTNHAIIWGGAMFALLHLNPWNFIGLWSFGSLLGFLRERTGSVYPSIAAHVINNSFALAVFSLQQPEDWELPPEFLPWYAVLPAGVLLVYAVWRLFRLTIHTAATGVIPDTSPPEIPN
jgi:membrane protease YdiL (CAAX protease family)